MKLCREQSFVFYHTFTFIFSVSISMYCFLDKRPGGYTVNLFSFYFYNVIWKLTASLQLQEFMTVVSSTTSGQPSPHTSNLRLGIFSLRMQHYRLF